MLPALHVADIKPFQGHPDTSRGEAYFKQLSDDIFYTSFARPGAHDEQQMWSLFGDGGTGVRLQFRLVSTIATNSSTAM
jgi:hypothetical protein